MTARLARAESMSLVGRVLTGVLFGASGLGPLAFAASIVLLPRGGLDWISLVSAKLFFALTFGGLGAAALTCAYLAAFRPDELTGGTIPPSLACVCPACGASVRSEDAGASCVRCGLGPQEARWHRLERGPVSNLFGAAITTGIGFLGVFLVAAMSRSGYQWEWSSVCVLMIVGVTFGSSIAGTLHFMRAYRQERIGRLRFASTTVNPIIAGVAVPGAAAVHATASVDAAGNLLLARGTSSWRRNASAGPATIEWSRERGDAPAAQLGYREEAAGDQWVYAERDAEEQEAQQQDEEARSARGTTPKTPAP